MKILLTNLTLATRTGTEIVTRDLATGLARAGHEAWVYSPLLGPVAREIIDAGVPVVSRLNEVAFEPDVIHGQHHVETTQALVHFKNIPAVFVCHDRLNWHDTSPRLTAVRRYVAVDRNCRERLEMDAGIPAECIRLILNAVDLRRYTPRSRLPEKPQRALAFSNYAQEGPELDMLQQACKEAGLKLDVIGSGMAAECIRPEDILGEYDLVFAKARCALEALAAGCSVILWDRQSLGPLVTSSQLHDLREWNFGMRCLQRRLTLEGVRCEIARYDAEDAARVTQSIRESASLDQAVSQYVQVYEEARLESSGLCVSGEHAVETLARRVNSLESQIRAAGEPLAMAPLPRQVAGEIGIRVADRVHRIAAGDSIQVSVEIDNRSSELLASLPPFPVNVAYHWLDSRSGECVVPEGGRTPLNAPVKPRSRHWQQASIAAPSEPGRYLLILTLVQEHQFWFDQTSDPVAVKWEVIVEASGRRGPEVRTLSGVIPWTSAQLVRDGEFENLGFVSDPKDGMLTFVETRPFLKACLGTRQATCVIVSPELMHAFPDHIGLAVGDDPKQCFFEIHNRLATETGFYGHDAPSTIHPTARLHPRCWVDERNVIIEAGVTIGPNATVLERATVGADSVIHAGAVIGSAGFQTNRRGGNPLELIHAGSTEIGTGCHIFANAVIARGLFRQSTRIGRGCRIGNGAFVSHNCVLGEEVFVGHGAVVNGNVRVGPRASIGPGASIVNCIQIGEAAHVSLGAAVARDVQPGARVTGNLAMEHRRVLRSMVAANKAGRS